MKTFLMKLLLLMILLEMMLEVAMGVMCMEVDNVADEVADTTNLCKLRHLVAEFPTYASGATWWPNFQQLQVVSLGG